MKLTIAERFWSKVEKSDGCWIWKGAITQGYGRFWVADQRRLVAAHRISYEFAFGKFDAALLVCHTCDNPRCVRPDHLFLGTHEENMHDMVLKGRNSNQRGRLTAGQVVELLASNETVTALALRFGVGRPTIYKIRSGKIWKSVPRRTACG